MGENTSTLAYAAGLFDGEGHITIGRFINSGKYISHTLYVCITNTDRKVLFYLSRIFGGRIMIKPAQESHHKVGYRWQLHSSSASHFLKEVFGFLKIKKSQAKLAIEFQDGIRRYAKGIPMGARELRRRENLRVKLHRLNSRGYTPLKMGGNLDE